MLPQIAPKTLAAQIVRPGAPIVLDLCLPEDFAADARLIPGAERAAHDALPRPDRDCVLVCQKGLKISQGATAHLRADGATAAYLTGGMVAWHAAGLPAVRAAALPGSGLWVTGDRPEAAIVHWMVSRWLDRDARLLVVPGESVVDIAARFDAAHAADAASFAARLGLDCPALDAVINAAGIKGARRAGLRALLAAAHAQGRTGQPDDPALPLLDLAYCAAPHGDPA